MPSPHQVLHFHWQRQGFLRQDPGTESAFTRLIGFYGSAPTCYLTVMARHPAFRFADLDQALYEDRSLARLRAMRYTQFMLPTAWIPIAFQATRSRESRDFLNLVLRSGVSEPEYQATSAAILGLVDDSSLTAGEIKKALGIASGPVGQAFSFIISSLCAQGRLVRAAVRGSWKSNLYEYTRFERWLPGVDLDSISVAAAQVELARLYFASYGPATAGDLQWWAGLTKDETSQALAGLDSALAEVHVDGYPDPYHLLAQDLLELQATPATPPQGVAFLPVWDAYLMAYQGRALFLDAARYEWVYDQGGNGTNAVLVDGRVEALWDMQVEKKQLIFKLAFFDQVPKAVREAAELFTTRLAGEIGAGEIRLEDRELPPPLGPAKFGRFRSPLKV